MGIFGTNKNINENRPNTNLLKTPFEKFNHLNIFDTEFCEFKNELFMVCKNQVLLLQKIFYSCLLKGVSLIRHILRNEDRDRN